MRYALVFLLLVVGMLVAYAHPAEAQTGIRETCYEQLCHIKITKDGFVPKTLIIKVGTTIVWTNVDDGRHTVTSGSPGEIISPLKSLMLEKDDTYEFTFEYSGLYRGSYKYFDQVTKIMRGEIIVEQEQEKKEEQPVQNVMKIDFSDPESGVRKVTLSNGNVLGMEIDGDFLSLRIAVQTVQAKGNMEITLDRSLIDSKDGERDGGFLVLLDGDDSVYEEESATSSERTLLINIPGGTRAVEIVGTQVLNSGLPPQMTAVTPYGEKVVMSWAPAKIEAGKEVTFAFQFFDERGAPINDARYDFMLMREDVRLAERSSLIFKGNSQKFTFADDQLGRVTLRLEKINDTTGNDVEFSMLVVPEFPYAIIAMTSVFAAMMLISRYRSLLRVN
jgi:plastocyanin